MDHDAFDVCSSQRKKHAFESVRAFISDAFRSRLIGLCWFFFDLDRIRSSARWIWSCYSSFPPDSNQPIKSVSGFVCASNSELSKNLPRVERFRDAPTVRDSSNFPATVRAFPRPS